MAIKINQHTHNLSTQAISASEPVEKHARRQGIQTFSQQEIFISPLPGALSHTLLNKWERAAPTLCARCNQDSSGLKSPSGIIYPCLRMQEINSNYQMVAAQGREKKKPRPSFARSFCARRTGICAQKRILFKYLFILSAAKWIVWERVGVQMKCWIAPGAIYFFSWTKGHAIFLWLFRSA